MTGAVFDTSRRKKKPKSIIRITRAAGAAGRSKEMFSGAEKNAKKSEKKRARSEGDESSEASLGFSRRRRMCAARVINHSLVRAGPCDDDDDDDDNNNYYSRAENGALSPDLLY